MTTGVLVMSYGTPRERDDIAAYYTDIRRGRPPTDEQLADLVRRYDAIGGTFPLRSFTEQQVAALAAALDRIDPGGYVVAAGTKHSTPTIGEGVRQLADASVGRIVGVVLAPHFSKLSIGDYGERAGKAASEHGLPIDMVESWHLLPAYLDFLAAAVRSSLQQVPAGSLVVFTAHSLPERILADGDPYPGQLRATAAAVADRLALDRWSVAWQSAGRTAQPWLGPDILDVVREAQGSPGIVVCACGFVSDHLEVAYDLDIEAAGLAASLALPFARTESVGSDPAVMTALAELVASA